MVLKIRISLLVPMMDIHLNDRKSPNSLVRRLAVNKLDSCIGILDELRNNFPEAGLVYKTFTAAINEQPNPDGEHFPATSFASRNRPLTSNLTK